MVNKILITGAGGDVGPTVCLALAGEGRTFALHARKETKELKGLAKRLKSYGAISHIVTADLSLPYESERVVAEATGLMRGIDAVVHLASSFEKTPFGKVTEEKWDEVMANNLRPAFFLAQEAARQMEKAGGKMVFFSDSAVQRPYGSYLPYSIAKAGVEALVKGLARTLGPKIAVNAVAPFAVTRPKAMTDKGWCDLLNKTLLRRANTTDEIVALVKFLLDSAETITGQVLTVDSGRTLR